MQLVDFVLRLIDISYFFSGTMMSLIDTVVPDNVAKWKPRSLMASKKRAVSALPYLR